MFTIHEVACGAWLPSTLTRTSPVTFASIGSIEVLDLVEIFAPDEATDHPFYSYVTADRARSWPAEEIWRAPKLETAAGPC